VVLLVAASGCGARQAGVCSPQQSYAEGQQLGAIGHPIDRAAASSRCGNSGDFAAGWEAGKREYCQPETLYNAGFATGLAAETMTYFERFFICGSDQAYDEYYRGYREGLDHMCEESVAGAYETARGEGFAGKPPAYASKPQCSDAHNEKLASESERGYRAGIELFCSSRKLDQQGVETSMRKRGFTSIPSAGVRGVHPGLAGGSGPGVDA
jgi:hypothetical protein